MGGNENNSGPLDLGRGKKSMVEISWKHNGKALCGRVGPAGIYGKYKENMHNRGTLGYGKICGPGASAMNLGHWMKISRIPRSQLWGHYCV